MYSQLSAFYVGRALANPPLPLINGSGQWNSFWEGNESDTWEMAWPLRAFNPLNINLIPLTIIWCFIHDAATKRLNPQFWCDDQIFVTTLPWAWNQDPDHVCLLLMCGEGFFMGF